MYTSMDRIPKSHGAIVLCMCRQHWTQQKTAFQISKPAKTPEALGICYISSSSNTQKQWSQNSFQDNPLGHQFEGRSHHEVSLTFWSLMHGYRGNPGSGSRVLLRAMCLPEYFCLQELVFSDENEFH